MKRVDSLKILKGIVFVLSFALFAFIGEHKAAYAEGEYDGKTIIIHSNDVHGQIDGYAYMTALEKDFESKGAEVIMADVGDFSQGTPYVTDSSGESAVEMMNAAGYDIATLGNHDFDFGDVQLKKNLETADFKIICDNVLLRGEPVTDPYYIYETKDGMKIGFFGLDTPETQTKSNPEKIKGLTFITKQDMYDCAQEQIDALKKEGVDVIVCLAHLGVSEESAKDGLRSVDLYANTKGIDIILDGHSHTVMEEGDNGEPIQQTGSKFEDIGVVIIDNAKKQIEDHYLIETDKLEKDPDVAAKADEIMAEVDKDYSEVIGQSEVELVGANEESRVGETNNGDFITDAMKWKVMQDPSLIEADEDHILVIINAGSIRDKIPSGDVTKMNLHTVLPYGNTLSVVYVTGSELLEALEASTFCTPEPLGGYPQTCGICFTLDTSVPYDHGEPYPDSTYYAPASIKRIKIDSVNGKPFNENDTYAVITNDFTAAGGDTYYAFKASEKSMDLGVDLDTTIIEYLQDELGGTITKAKYGEPRGDQKIIGDGTASVSNDSVSSDSAASDTGKSETDSSSAENKEQSSDADNAQTGVDKAEGSDESGKNADETEGTESADAESSGKYEVVKGDCLWKIAEQKLGDGSRWKEIYELNKGSISNPRLIFIGQELVLPAS